MEKIPVINIISGSVREGRNSHRVASFFKTYLSINDLAQAEILDLKVYNFPLFDERLQYMKEPEQNVLDFANKIKKSDGIIIVTPEYNGGYPAALKNAMDLLYNEWYHKPVAIATVSDGDFAGTQVITSLQFSFWKMRALLVPARFNVAKVQENFTEDGTPNDLDIYNKRASGFIKELLWLIHACEKMK